MDYNFWVNRIKKHGHTGWANPSIYFYDQILRINAIKSKISKYQNINNALDYGCGTGDFSRLLSSMDISVDAYDIHKDIINIAKSRSVSDINSIRYFSEFGRCFENQYDLILSVTVLQHIINDDELRVLLKELFNNINVGGYFIMLESVSNLKNNNSKHVHARTAESWKSLFLNTGFTLDDEIYYWHPSEHPTGQYQIYSSSILTKLLSALSRLGSGRAKKRLIQRAKSMATGDVSYFTEKPTPSLLMVWRKDK